MQTKNDQVSAVPYSGYSVATDNKGAMQFNTFQRPQSPIIQEMNVKAYLYHTPLYHNWH